MTSLSTGTVHSIIPCMLQPKKSRYATNEVKRKERNHRSSLKLTVPGQSSNDTALVCCILLLYLLHCSADFLTVFGLASRQSRNQCFLSPDLRAFSRSRLRELVVEDSMSMEACRARDATSFLPDQHREAKACLSSRYC
ncbi:hypothetical protein NOF04DRAFT_3771 [Fusarium oxysporum II5]|uniref:Uncharacterized protein n=2 Tax=Fusarium oxysporum species complex TaxID=171631 RepID=X0JWD7_FUSO5|nr:uncharacterized protein FOIG_07689 [Fusarium odoratissimum NRRL 54006]EXM00772.1 hypothetical protein FOIG_07689 [Fusarium odoratissimum NRRL 54006]KAK2127349.1 hypothetical protein NOF04DRAFT_3771 [Fusarium oxysporum II5]TXB98586.1 hypothetical protein FocTR4_00013252 [Fusarium oxysporum f. sp. cubense]